ncbi:rhodanese-like domain-containing protein [Endozoicomonas sp. SCSIO W0465]|uniref:rhodanese-like domain-containing protein n=1 Tax=Endozoicomonas sp. SCSIO W0465 TaxID=2918516 RepID=UPI002075160B|nr:rhodanese-like domain-containing protein [Endozoicomonas sp. SCSIO W0465]USE35600.1 rhodanese-like domain-containing protein [Endozoicomonas sp. SCSIO W0465]
MGILVAFGVISSAKAADSYDKAWERVQNGALLVDVRTPAEYSAGHLTGAINIPFQDIVEGLAQRNIPRETDIVLYCRSGSRSGKAQKALVNVGYQRALNAGGYEQLLARRPQP